MGAMGTRIKGRFPQASGQGALYGELAAAEFTSDVTFALPIAVEFLVEWRYDRAEHDK